MTDRQTGALLFDLALILVLALLSGRVARRFGQPAVIGEILIGILAGPSLFHGEIARHLFPLPVRPFLTAVADLGLVAFMFTVGMELDRRTQRGLNRVTAGTAAGATLVPFGMGVLLAIYLATRDRANHHLGFVLFIGVAMSVTAFPVLARIVTDLRMSETVVGTVALSAAAACDIAAWTMLAIIQAIVDGVSHWQVVLVVPYAAVMFLAARPLLKKLLGGRAAGPLPAARLAVVLAGLMASAAITQLLGLHFVFGAFLFGLVMPDRQTTAPCAEILDRMELVTVFLLPAYFVVTGLQVNLAGIGVSGLAELALILVTAVTAKVGGTFLGARTHGLPRRQATALAALMNTRGLTELIVLSVGLKIGVLDQRLYSLMVVMAVVSTAMTGPLLRLFGAGDQEAAMRMVTVPSPEDRAVPLRPGGR